MVFLKDVRFSQPSGGLFGHSEIEDAAAGAGEEGCERQGSVGEMSITRGFGEVVRDCAGVQPDQPVPGMIVAFWFSVDEEDDEGCN